MIEVANSSATMAHI